MTGPAHGPPGAAAARPAPIEGYGLLGDTRTAALVGEDGSIDWFCAPRFDSPPLFGRLVGGPQAGAFQVGPAGPATLLARRYVGATATIEATWAVGPGRLRLRDAMVAEVAGDLLPTTVLVRHVEAEGAPVEVAVHLDPRQGEQHRRPRWRQRGRDLVCQWGPLAVSVGAAPALALEPGCRRTIVVEPGRPLTVVLAVADREPLVHLDPAAAGALVAADEARWEAWADAVDADVPWRDAVVRSLLTLRLLTYSPSGAPVAAPTTSLPEELGGSRNWDYRYAWPRDASIGVAAFAAVGMLGEARSFLAWLLHASRLSRPRLPVLLTLQGRRAPRERELPGWPGYAGSRPVRVGNGAAEQHQLDVYGWVVDAAWAVVRQGHRLDSETWRAVRGFADVVSRRWREPDHGIWEVRGDAAQHVHSKLLGWLALDRAARIAETHPTRRSRRAAWLAARDELAREVRERGFDPARGTYTRTYGSRDLDAALLVLPLLGLEEPGSARIAGTIAAVRAELGAGGGLLHRYPPGCDGLPGAEGAFLPCSFWLVQALAASGRADEAAELFDGLLARAGPLGLYAEELDPATGRHLGNHPQALTHAALVQAALALRDAATVPGGGAPPPGAESGPCGSPSAATTPGTP